MLKTAAIANETHTAPQKRGNHCKQCSMNKICITAQFIEKNPELLESFQFPTMTLYSGDVLYHQGQKNTAYIYAVKQGTFKSIIAQEGGYQFISQFILPPNIIGWETIKEQHHSETVVAIEQAVVCRIGYQKFIQLLQQIPPLQSQLFHFISRRIRDSYLCSLKLTVEQRLANFLLNLNQQYKTLGSDGKTYKLVMSYQDIANYLRATPETISRSFRSLQIKGYIRYTNKILTICEIDKLSKVGFYKK